MKGLELTDENGKPLISIKRFNKYLTDWSSKVLKLQNWVDGTKDAVIRGVNAEGKIDWENAVDLVAKDEDAEMHFNIKGLQYSDPKTGDIRTAMGSDGSFYAEHGIFGDIIALKGKMCQIDAALRCDSGGFEVTIGQTNKYSTGTFDSEKGLTVGSENYALGLSSGQLIISSRKGGIHTGNYGPSYLRLVSPGGHELELNTNTATFRYDSQRFITSSDLQQVLGKIQSIQNLMVTRDEMNQSISQYLKNTTKGK